MNSNDSYHLGELEIARTPSDPRHILPPIASTYRHILDVGCGAGQTLIACDLGVGVAAVGVDQDETALRLGRKLCSTIHFVCAKAEHLPFASAAFDFVICRVALPYMHTETALGEMSRVLKTGGKLWATLRPLSRSVKDVVLNVARLNVRQATYAAYVLANGIAYSTTGTQFPLPTGRYASFQTSRGVTRALLSQGFRDIEITRGRFFVVSASRA